jgi:hypothetical protein
MATILLPNDFKEFLQFFHSRNVEYLLIGGWAVAYHGYPRATGDMDVWIAATPTNAERVIAALDDFGFGVSMGATVDLFSQPDRVVRMGNPPLRIEVLTSISGVEFSDCYHRRITAILDEVSVTIISLEDLKKNKVASGRMKDLNDLQNLP